MKMILFHNFVTKEIVGLPIKVGRELVSLFSLLAKGVNLGLPVSRPMPAPKNEITTAKKRLKDMRE